MKPENELAMIVAFYLSKFGKHGLKELGFQSYAQAFREVGQYLGVNPNSVKNWRDEFDPYYDNERRGWYQRGIRPSRQKVMESFDGMSEQALRAVVKEIITPTQRTDVSNVLQTTIEEIRRSENEKVRPKDRIFVPRGVTGRLAEEFFIAQHAAGTTPFGGMLVDRRDEGVGFDFQIERPTESVFVEIKGLAAREGGVTFTDKEWNVANERKDSYFLGLVTEVSNSPRIGFVQNPACRLTPRHYVYTSVSISWSVSTDQLSSIGLT